MDRLPVVEAAQHQAVGVRMRHHFEYAADDDLRPVPGQAFGFGARHVGVRQPVDVPVLRGQADVFDRFHFQPGKGQAFGELLGGEVEIDVVFQPGQGNSHGMTPYCGGSINLGMRPWTMDHRPWPMFLFEWFLVY